MSWVKEYMIIYCGLNIVVLLNFGTGILYFRILILRKEDSQRFYLCSWNIFFYNITKENKKTLKTGKGL